jgi:hypothetical protein
MSVGPFLTHDSGYLSQFTNASDFLGSGVAAVLVTTAHTPNRATDNAYSAISSNEADDADYSAQALGSKTVAVESTRIRVSCGKITFTAEGDVTGRYIYLVYGDAADLQAADVILGHIDLTGDGNASSIGAEFSFTPHANGLFEIERSAAPA